VTSLQTEILIVSILFWATLTLVLAWITKKIRDVEAALKEIKHHEEKRDED
jgi:hypothetical protein